MWPFELLNLTELSKPIGRFQRCRMREVIDKVPVAEFFAPSCNSGRKGQVS